MIRFLKEAKSTERKIVVYYVRKHAILHITMSIACFSTALVFVLGPLLLSTPLPTDAKYPFTINSSFTRSIIYLHQSTVALQVASGMTIDCLCASLLWFTAARFQILAKNFQTIRCRNDAFLRIRQHQHLLM